MNKILKIVIVGGGILILGCVGLAVIAPSVSPTLQSNTAQPKAPIAAPTQKAVSVTQPQSTEVILPTAPPEPTAAVAKQLITVSGKLLAKCTPSIIFEPKADKKLVGVQVTLKNNSSEIANVNPLYFSLVDSEGFVYAAQLASCDEQIDTTKLASGQAIRGIVGFLIPLNASPKQIQYKPNIFNAPSIISELEP